MTDGECETEIWGRGGKERGGVGEMKLEKVIKMERGRLGRDGGGEEDTMQSGTWDEGGWSGGGGGGLKRQREMMAARRSESLRGPQPHRVRASSCSAVIDRRFVPLRL